jgi:hyaluronoglucosaminidase
MAEFIHRGVIEGFYGPPYTHADRLWLIERLGAWGMNRYVYAPKDDPLHRAWRTPYDGAVLREFAELIERGHAVGVEVGFAVSPGLTIEYAAADDVRALQAKFRSFHDLGARFFSLALDDVPTVLLHAGDQARFASLADAHVHLCHAVAEAVGSESTLWLVPTDYVGVAPTDYLELLGRDLAPSIEIGWTGRTVLSPTIPVGEAAQRAATLQRRLLIWDNVPVADGPMRPMLHLAPYAGRANPMLQARPSALAIRTAADYMRDPDAYDAEAAWREALRELGHGAPDAFAVFAAAHRFSPQFPEDRDPELESVVTALRGALATGGNPAPALRSLRQLLDARVATAESLRADLADRQLAEQIEPWLVSHKAESERMAAALDLLEVLLSDTARMQQVFGFFRLEGMLTRIAPTAVASYGPRRVLYPQLGSMRDDGAAFGADQALFLDRCLADELVELAEQLALARLSA